MASLATNQDNKTSSELFSWYQNFVHIQMNITHVHNRMHVLVSLLRGVELIGGDFVLPKLFLSQREHTCILKSKHIFGEEGALWNSESVHDL